METVRALPSIEKDDYRAGLEKLRRMLPFMAEYAVIEATLRKAKYDACVGAGFSAAQALDIARAPL